MTRASRQSAVLVTVLALAWGSNFLWIKVALAVAALVGNAVPHLLFAIGEQTVDSALAGLLNTTTPLWTVLVALAVGQERSLGTTRIVGLAVGFAGTLVIFQPWHTDATSDLGGQLACLAAAACYAISFVYIARYLTPLRLSPFVLAFGQTSAATILLAPALLVGGRQATDIDGSVLAAMAMLGFVGTGFAYLLPVVRRTPAGADQSAGQAAAR